MRCCPAAQSFVSIDVFYELRQLVIGQPEISHLGHAIPFMFYGKSAVSFELLLDGNCSLKGAIRHISLPSSPWVLEKPMMHCRHVIRLLQAAKMATVAKLEDRSPHVLLWQSKVER